jgi:hypothetical protein
MSRNNNLAKIHIAKKQLGMDEDTYRAFLKGLTGKDSAKAMDPGEHTRVIREMERMGFTPTVRPGAKRFDELGLRSGMPSPGTLRMIEALWHQVSRANDEKLALRRFLFKHYGVDDIKFLDFDSAEKAKEALKSMAYRAQGGRW